jgi:hypothetical protein
VPMQALTDLTAPTSPRPVRRREGHGWPLYPPCCTTWLASGTWSAPTALFWHGCNAVVFPVRQRSRPLALKLAWPVDQTSGEADALIEWRGRGIVERVAADVPRGALPLERLGACNRWPASLLPRPPQPR